MPSARRVTKRILIGAGAVTALLIFGVLSGMLRCDGYEFCPQRFVRRSFVFYQIPGIRLRISPVFRATVTNDLEAYLSTRPRVVLSGENKDNAPRWDVVSLSAWRTQWQGDPHVLCQMLDANDADTGLYWLSWSHEHTELSNALWPLVARLAREGQYVLIPELMTLAEGSRDVRDFRQAADRFLAGRLKRLAHAASQASEHAKTLALCTWTLELRPDDADVLRLQDKAREASGEGTPPAADSRQANPSNPAASP